ncbi:hypothetical protein SAMN02745202_00848 [Segatella oulorum]|uniref:Fimbrillin-like n=1 Tax=Segatella oulorum TaxID=28136 RepID=A0A1T4MSW6_9BACT|nr:hypothetical protein [Segatella oulorum]SJZ69927.1 hypothetical protein SAMN02745202_00848 [Segatella oulorum]
MKKINRLTLVLTLMAAGLFAGCASDEEATRENQKIALDGSHFKFTEVAYQADQAVTRAAAPVKPTAVDLGDGLEAEVSVTPDAPTGKTRAVDPISDGKYTILAFDPTTHDLQGKLEGSVTGGVFTPDAGQKLLLDPGTYDFTCFSESVVYDEPNNRLVVNHLLTKSPTIGHVQATIAGDDYEVAFNMEHKAIRVRFNITSDILSENTPIDAYLEGGVFGPYYWIHDWYTAYSGVLNNAGNGDIGTSGSLNFKTVAPVTTQAGTTYTSDYVYMLPGIDGHDHISNYPIHFNAGTIGGASLVGKTVGVGTGFQWAINQSITINVNVKGQLYLFEDGKARVLAGKGTHTPIGVVLQQKWEPTNQKGMACALEDASLDAFWEDPAKTGLAAETQRNQTVYADLYSGQNDLNGYNWTWDANSTTDHVVRANEQEKYPAFYAAGHYRPSFTTVTGANVGKWYLPAIGEVLQLFKKFTPVNLSSSMGWGGIVSAIDKSKYRKLENAFTNVGSTIYLNSFFWTSTTADANGYYKYGPVAYNLMTSVYEPGTYVLMKNIHAVHVIPFVHF